MPIPTFHFDDETRGLPRQPVPVRFACIATGWSPNTIASLASGKTTGYGGPLIDIHAFNDITKKAGDVAPSIYAAILKSLSGNLSDDLQKLPANHFVWSDNLAYAFTTLINEADDTDEIRQYGIKIYWNPELGENTSVIDECPDLSKLVKDESSQNESSTPSAEESLPTQPTRSIIPITLPERKDDWNVVICACIDDFEAEHQYTPNEFELWQKLRTYQNRAHGEISVEIFASEEHLILAACKKRLGRDALAKRYARLYPPISTGTNTRRR